MTTVGVQQLHQSAVVADTHNDLLMSVVARRPDRWAAYFRENWLPQLRDGGVDVQVLPVFIDDAYRPEGALRQTLRMIEAAHRIAEGNPDEVALCLDGASIEATLASGRIALVLALEGCPAIDADVELFESMHRLGVRIASLTHFGRTALADGSGEDGTGGRLTRAGVAALAEMERLGILFDVSHLGAAGVDHVLELATRPVIATHSSARALRDHHRNLDDSHLKEIAAGGGVVCVNFFAGFVDETEHTLDRLVDHLEHVAAVAGIDHVGIGPDFLKEVEDEVWPAWRDDYVIEGIDVRSCIPGLEGPRGLPLVTEALLRRGVAEDDVVKVLGANIVRLFRAELGRRAEPRVETR
jgi:membrane dipeptidase